MQLILKKEKKKEIKAARLSRYTVYDRKKIGF